MPYFNATSAAGVVWGFGTSSLASTGTFTVEGQSSTAMYVLRNLYIPKGASTDIYVAFSTGSGATVLVASGVTESYNSFHFLIVSSTQTLTIKNNSNATAIYGGDGVVIRS